MKLFTKIFLQVACIIFVLSSIIFFYTSYRWKNQSIQDINSYEESKFQNNLLQFENKLRLWENQPVSLDNSIQKELMVYAFRRVFRDTAALYQEGKELYNGTSYEFEIQDICKLLKNQENENSMDEQLYGGTPLTAKINGKTLLLFYSATNYDRTDTKYQIVTYKDITEVQKRNQLLFWRAGGLTLFLLLFTALLLFLSLRKIMRPLAGLSEAAICVANGNYERKVPVEGNTELAQVGKSFNLMTDKVKEQIEELSSVNQAQRQLLGSLAHELKTPMTAIIGYADTLLTMRLSPARQEKALSYIGNECHRLSRLSVKMLELTGLYETGEARFSPEEIQAASFLENVRQLVAYRLKEKNISLEIICQPPELMKIFDPDLMTSVVTNFIDNAVKASEEDSRIVITATKEKLVVQDFGKGIPKEDLGKVTEAFYMVDKSRSRAKGSVGLGLSLCEKIVEIHGFQLEITSKVGEGTIVSVLW